MISFADIEEKLFHWFGKQRQSAVEPVQLPWVSLIDCVYSRVGLCSVHREVCCENRGDAGASVAHKQEIRMVAGSGPGASHRLAVPSHNSSSGRPVVKGSQLLAWVFCPTFFSIFALAGSESPV